MIVKKLWHKLLNRDRQATTSITKRWVRGSLLFTLTAVLLAELFFIYYMVGSYHSSARNVLQSKLDQLYVTLDTATTGSGMTAKQKETRMRSLVQDFDERGKFELMLVDKAGNVVMSSSGVLPVQTDVPQDIKQALQTNAPTYSDYIGKNETGESVLAMTRRTPYVSENVVAIRLVSSMTRVNRSIGTLVFGSIIVLFIIVAASMMSGSYFIRSIVLPLQKVEATASRIAQGDFNTRIENNSNDEIGSLCNTINDMAEELGRTEKMKNEFISSVSHELRTPLTSIKGWTETVENIKDPNDPNFKRGVHIIAGETNRLYDMVEELLDFSRMQNGLQLEKELLDMAAEVEEAVLISHQRAENNGVTIVYDAPELPVPVHADKNRVRQVLLNILDNAIKYSKHGAEVQVDVLSRDGLAMITIEDTGKGISPEDLENVKVKFYKGAGAMRGSGIGLAVVEEIMQAHRGLFDIESEQNKGTKVTLRFPLYGV